MSITPAAADLALGCGEDPGSAARGTMGLDVRSVMLVGVLLSLLGVDPNFTAAVEGLILILVLAGRSLARKVRTS